MPELIEAGIGTAMQKSKKKVDIAITLIFYLFKQQGDNIQEGNCPCLFFYKGTIYNIVAVPYYG